MAELASLAVDAALVVIVLEAMVMVLRRRGSIEPGALAAALANLAAGLFLMLALRGALAGAAWPWIVAGLSLAGAAHLADWLLRPRPRRRTDAAP